MFNMHINLVKNKFIQTKIIENKKILFNIDDGIILELNDISFFIWEALDAGISGQALAKNLIEYFDVDWHTAIKDTRQVLEIFFKNEFIDYTSSFKEEKC